MVSLAGKRCFDDLWVVLDDSKLPCPRKYSAFSGRPDEVSAALRVQKQLGLYKLDFSSRFKIGWKVLMGEEMRDFGPISVSGNRRNRSGGIPVGLSKVVADSFGSKKGSLQILMDKDRLLVIYDGDEDFVEGKMFVDFPQQTLRAGLLGSMRNGPYPFLSCLDVILYSSLCSETVIRSGWLPIMVTDDAIQGRKKTVFGFEHQVFVRMSQRNGLPDLHKKMRILRKSRKILICKMDIDQDLRGGITFVVFTKMKFQSNGSYSTKPLDFDQGGHILNLCSLNGRSVFSMQSTRNIRYQVRNVGCRTDVTGHGMVAASLSARANDCVSHDESRAGFWNLKKGSWNIEDVN